MLVSHDATLSIIRQALVGERDLWKKNGLQKVAFEVPRLLGIVGAPTNP